MDTVVGKINLGCGKNLLSGFINIDNEYPKNWTQGGQKFLKRDITRGLPFSDNTIDRIEAISILEHLLPDDMIFVMNECWRVLRVDNELLIKVPYWKSEACWRDPTHVRGFSLETSKYFDQNKIVDYQTYGFMPWNIKSAKMLRNRQNTEDSMIEWVLTPYSGGDWIK